MFEDWLFHAALPVVAYGSIVGGAVALLTDTGGALFAIAAATLLLVFVGIHNAWDTVTWITLVAKERNAEERSRGRFSSVRAPRGERLHQRPSRHGARGDAVTSPRCVGTSSSGGTGYIGRALIDARAAHAVTRCARSAQRKLPARLPAGVEFIVGNALDASSYASEVMPADTLVQLVGTPHRRRTRRRYRRVDLPSGLAGVDAALQGNVRTSCTSASRSRHR